LRLHDDDAKKKKNKELKEAEYRKRILFFVLKFEEREGERKREREREGARITNRVEDIAQGTTC